jgi:hypothetical protein
VDRLVVVLELRVLELALNLVNLIGGVEDRSGGDSSIDRSAGSLHEQQLHSLSYYDQMDSPWRKGNERDRWMIGIWWH